MATITERVVAFCNALAKAEPFPAATYVEQLQEHSRKVPDTAFLESKFGPGLSQEKFLQGEHLSSHDASLLIHTLAQASTACSLATIPASDDPYGFRECINHASIPLIDLRSYQGALELTTWCRKSKASRALTDSLTRLLGYCYADHLDKHLTESNQPTLNDLYSDQAFCEAFQKGFLNPENILDQIEHDVSKHNVAYSSSLLFVSNFFQHQATPTVHESRQIWLKSFGSITEKRLTAVAAFPADFRSEVALAVKSLPINYGVMIDEQSSGEYLRPPTSNEVLQPLQNMPVSKEVQQAISDITSAGLHLGDWRSYGEMVVNLWDDVKSRYNTAVQAEAKAEIPHYEQGISMGGPDAPPPPTIITTVKGETVKDWITRGRTSHPEFVVEGPPKNWSISQTNPLGSCFVAGTQVSTRHGPKGIENLAENDWVLTRGDSNEWGLVSDEKVHVDVQSPIIHGFNDDNPFFTSGHVFFTTTGLRALDPLLAMQENPWADVGRLAVGHVLLRLDPGSNKYEQVLVRSITSQQMPQVEKVYGVHLREGRRSYHANGYMVAVNYPEITLKSICKMLETVPTEQQARMLFAFKELQPLFQRFGIGTIADVLQTEINAGSERNSMRVYKNQSNKLAGPAHGSMQFNPEEISSADYTDIPASLPTISISEGMVFVNDQVCEIASINNESHEVGWTRKIDKVPEIFEHGRLIIDPASKAAHGALRYSKDVENQSPSSISQKSFLALPSDLGSPPSYDEAMVAPAPEYYAAGAAAAPEELHWETTESVAAEDANSSTAMEHVNISADAKTSEQIPASVERMKPVLRPLRFHMIFDENKWKPNQIDATDPADFGSIDFAVSRKHVDGLSASVVTVPVLDQILDLINAKHIDPKLGSLRTLYDSALQDLGDGRVQATIKLTPNAQELLIRYKDEVLENEGGSYKVTFKENLDTDMTLGMMFSSIEMTLGPDRKTAQGAIWELDLNVTSGEGKKHLLISHPGELAKRVNIEIREGGSAAAGGINTGSATMPISTPQIPVAPVRMGALGEYHVATIDWIKYDNSALEVRTRTILENMMFYHMHPEDLHKIYDKSHPPTVPDKLGSNLPGDLKKWIRDTYSPAFTALQIAESYNTKDWVYKFSDKEKAKILYFWQGEGPKCLASSQEYKLINQLCVREAMLQLYPVLQQFISDDGPNWAAKYYSEIMDTRLEDIVEQVVKKDEQPLQQYCNILYALDPDTPFSKKLYQDVTQKVASILMLHPTRMEGDEAPWLPDAISWLTEVLLNPNDTRMSTEAREAFMKDFEAFQAEQGKEVDRTNRTLASNMFSEQMKSMMTFHKSVAAGSVLFKGLWYRSSGVVKNESILHSVDLSKAGNKYMTTIKCLMLISTLVMTFKSGVELSGAEKAQLGANLAGSVLDILSPHIVKQEARTLVQAQAEAFLINEKLQQYPFGTKNGPQVNTSIEHHMEQIGIEATNIEQAAANETGFVARVKRKISMPQRYLRILGIAVGVAYSAFLIWDICAHGGKMSTGQYVLGIVQIVLEVAIVVCEVLALVLPAFACIPVIGQILVILVLIAGIVAMFVGNTVHQNTPGENFVLRMQNGADGNPGWLTTIDHPPSALLSYTIAMADGSKEVTDGLEVTAENKTGRDITFKEPTKKLGTGEPSNENVASTTLCFFAGTDEPCLFTNASFAASGTQGQAGAGSWSVEVAESSMWDIKLLKPSGTNVHSTQYHLRVKPLNDGKTQTVLKNGARIKFTVKGTLNKEGTSNIKVVEARPGAPFCVVPYTYTRK